MLSIKPTQRASEKGKCSSWSNQDFRRSTTKHYSKKLEWIYSAKKDA